ncbi:MAG: LacI family DNA-binding transcriptional regulator [Acidimicrobiia bacterium]|nr:LacI family DNA-binding transcriptional regulator [Acidimicrobiia bacterium]
MAPTTRHGQARRPWGVWGAEAPQKKEYPPLVTDQPQQPDHGPGARVSLRDVAARAGVSVATASRVMSGSSHPVSVETKQRVMSAAESIGFEPNRLARALVTARSQTIGVMVHDISDPYFGEIVKGLEDGLRDSDYRIFVASSDRAPGAELDYVRAFRSQQVDALVFAASGLDHSYHEEELSRLVNRYRRAGGVAVALSDHVLNLPHVRFENHSAVADMVSYLVDKGHSRIAYLNGPPELSVCRVRLNGYHTAMEKFGLDHGDALVEGGGFSPRGGFDAVAKLAERTEFTAVLAANDLMAIGATRRLVASGIGVPDQVSVAGLDDIAISEYGPVPLTTMRLPTDELGRHGAMMILSMLAGESVDNVSIPGSLVERESVGPVPK